MCLRWMCFRCTTRPYNGEAEWYSPDAAFSLWSCCWGAFRVSGSERSESTGGDMALTMTAHFLRNNPIHPGRNVRVLLMLSFVSGRFDRAWFAASWARKPLAKFGGIQRSVESIERLNMMPSRLADGPLENVTMQRRLCHEKFLQLQYIRFLLW